MLEKLKRMRYRFKETCSMWLCLVCQLTMVSFIHARDQELPTPLASLFISLPDGFDSAIGVQIPAKQADEMPSKATLEYRSVQEIATYTVIGQLEKMGDETLVSPNNIESFVFGTLVSTVQSGEVLYRSCCIIQLRNHRQVREALLAKKSAHFACIEQPDSMLVYRFINKGDEAVDTYSYLAIDSLNRVIICDSIGDLLSICERARDKKPHVKWEREFARRKDALDKPCLLGGNVARVSPRVVKDNDPEGLFDSFFFWVGKNEPNTVHLDCYSKAQDPKLMKKFMSSRFEGYLHWETKNDSLCRATIETCPSTNAPMMGAKMPADGCFLGLGLTILR